MAREIGPDRDVTVAYLHHLISEWMNVLSQSYRRESGMQQFWSYLLQFTELQCYASSPYCWSYADVRSTGWLCLLSDCMCCTLCSCLCRQKGCPLLFAFPAIWVTHACDSPVTWPGLRDGLNILGRGKHGRGLWGCCENLFLLKWENWRLSFVFWLFWVLFPSPRLHSPPLSSLLFQHLSSVIITACHWHLRRLLLLGQFFRFSSRTCW